MNGRDGRTVKENGSVCVCERERSSLGPCASDITCFGYTSKRFDDAISSTSYTVTSSRTTLVHTPTANTQKRCTDKGKRKGTEKEKEA